MTPDQLKDAQGILKLNNTQLAELLGCSRSTITKYRNGSQPVPKDTAMALRLLVVCRETLDKMPPGKVRTLLHYGVESAIR